MRHPLGTARIAALSLRNSELHTVSLATEHQQQTEATIEDLMARQPVLIYPGKDALPVSGLGQLPVRPLLFIDASWRKSRRLLHAYPAIGRLPMYRLAETPLSRYRIRREPMPGAVSTLEAIVGTLSLLEPDTPGITSMLTVMDWMVNQQIEHMGKAVYAANYHGKSGYHRS